MSTTRRDGGYGRGRQGEVVEELGRRIVGGTPAVGEILDVAALTAELGISHTVLREALSALKAKGLIEARQKRGTFVQPRSEWRLLDPDVIRWHLRGHRDCSLRGDLVELRGIVEPATARLAAVALKG